jgi:hypothetical protein
LRDVEAGLIGLGVAEVGEAARRLLAAAGAVMVGGDIALLGDLLEEAAWPGV